jgi:carboxylesterase type B
MLTVHQADEHDVVVVSINYRVNIFGFPRADFLPDQNIALLDQRLGIEWVRDKYLHCHPNARRRSY